MTALSRDNWDDLATILTLILPSPPAAPVSVATASTPLWGIGRWVTLGNIFAFRVASFTETDPQYWDPEHLAPLNEITWDMNVLKLECRRRTR